MNLLTQHAKRNSVTEEDVTVLDDFILMDCIGRGQFGVVFKGLSRSHGNFVAVKKLAQEADKMSSLMTEIDLLKSLSHPNIVKYIQHVSTKTHVYIIMEYIENGSLRSLLRKCGNLPELLVCTYLEQVLRGLQYLHHQGVIHRDIKAANLLVSTDGTIKVTDFGVSTRYDLTGKAATDIAGTPNWMAPEVIQGQPPTTACDIWSLGITIIELLAGNPPFFELKQEAAIYKIVMEDHPPLPIGISSALEDFLLKCFKKEEGIRPTADQLLQHPWIQRLEQNRTSAGAVDPSKCDKKSMADLLQNDNQDEAVPLLHLATMKNKSTLFNPEEVEESLRTVRRRELMQALSVAHSDQKSLSFSHGVEEQRACIEQQHQVEQEQQQQPQVQQQQQKSRLQLLPSKDKPIIMDDGDDDFLDGLDGLDDIDIGKPGKPGVLGKPGMAGKPTPTITLQPPPSVNRENSSSSETDDGFASIDGPIKIQTCSNSDTLDPDFWDDDLFNPAEDAANEQKRQQAQIDIVKQLNILDGTKDCTRFFKACCELDKLLSANKQDISILVQPSMVATSLQHMLKPYFPLLVLTEQLKVFAQNPTEENSKATTALLTVLSKAALNNSDVVNALCSLQTVSNISKCTAPAFSDDTRIQALVFLYGLAASKNPVALDNMLSFDCLSSLCDVLETKYEGLSRNKALIISAIDCLWSIAHAQNQILTVTCCYTMSNILFTEHLVHALTELINSCENETLSESDIKSINKGAETLLTFASVFSPPFRKSMCTTESINAFNAFLTQLKTRMCEGLTMCVLNIMKVLHHASSDESNGNALGQLIERVIPFLGLSFSETSGKNAFTRRNTPAEINNQILHILYNLCSLNPARALIAAKSGLVPIIERSLREDWPMRELVLPVLFNMLRSSSGEVSAILWENAILPQVIQLLSDQSWCADACGCLGMWLVADSEKHVRQDLLKPENVMLLKNVLQVHKGSTNFPKLLATYSTLAQSDAELATALVNKGVAEDVVNAISQEKISFTRVALMRLLLALYKNTEIGKTDLPAIQSSGDALKKIVEHDTSALVKNISKEIMSIIDKHTASQQSA